MFIEFTTPATAKTVKIIPKTIGKLLKYGKPRFFKNIPVNNIAKNADKKAAKSLTLGLIDIEISSKKPAKPTGKNANNSFPASGAFSKNIPTVKLTIIPTPPILGVSLV